MSTLNGSGNHACSCAGLGIAWPLAGLTPRFANLPRRLRLASGLISLIVGLAITYQIGVVDGLFGAVGAVVAQQNGSVTARGHRPGRAQETFS